MKKNGLFFLAFLGLQASVKAQQDTIPTRLLDTVTVSTKLKGSYYLPAVEGTGLFAGKKTNVLYAATMDGNLAANVQRTAFAKIPGLNMWEMDGAGTQLNIATRGTDAHRCIEMNMRQNGYNTNSDMFGYPENHYTVPLEAIQEVQYIRGSAALQFGSQFGGMMNFILKEADSIKPFALESVQTAGSNNLFNSYNAVGGTAGKISYYAYYDYRHGDGWRDEARFDYHAYYANFKYSFNSKGSIALQFSRMDYVQQIAGGLDDDQFKQNNKQATRARNYFQPFINIPALVFNYNLSNRTQLNVTAHGIFGERNSVQFINPPNIADTFNTAIGSYNPRQLDRDYYKGFTTEAKILHSYNLGKNASALSAGVRYFNEDTRRKQKGTGTTGSDFDLTMIKPYGIDLKLHTANYAVFAENMFAVSKNFMVIPGIRYEVINSSMNGVLNNASDHVAYKGKRSFPLAGLGLQYQVAKTVQVYGNISQAYRPYIYANITPATQLDQVDPNLKDSKGYDIDLGIRGNINNVFRFDINPYYLFYGDRVGLLSFVGNDNATHLLTTNIGNSVSKGVEAYTELVVWKNGYTSFLSVFNSLAYNHSRYTSAEINKSGVNTSIKGNYVENSPDWLEKAGVNMQYRNFSTGFQFSYTSKCYNDALNTVSSTNGVTGLIPAYHVWDWNFSWNIVKQFTLSGGINNFTNEKYFNRRITMYPGPGILPADGRTFYITGRIKI
ncbi:TonB-dependent receptor family protein [Parafilimonas terrae]|uniref:Fe(3+) dicitrate transport protein n=1 Tax=Parafilimonas terrae TaxID=1465490 RepID=A0A1I5XQ52_9BACT|nr:TonB-dependent receptor [Parafilimonas terrae]SFQ34082.1 Fe(3+) dicitrate transport protein [Parafilimonas terrae]